VKASEVIEKYVKSSMQKRVSVVAIKANMWWYLKRSGDIPKGYTIAIKLKEFK